MLHKDFQIAVSYISHICAVMVGGVTLWLIQPCITGMQGCMSNNGHNGYGRSSFPASVGVTALTHASCVFLDSAVQQRLWMVSTLSVMTCWGHTSQVALWQEKSCRVWVVQTLNVATLWYLYSATWPIVSHNQIILPCYYSHHTYY